MKRLVIECSDEMAMLLQKLSASGEVVFKEETTGKSNPGQHLDISSYFGIIPQEERESWRKYAQNLGREE